MNTKFSDSLQWIDWCSKIPGYSKMTNNQKKKAKKKYKMAIERMSECCLVSSCSPAEPTSTPCALTIAGSNCSFQNLAVTTTQKEKAMDTTTIYDIEDDKRGYLRNRMFDISFKKASKLEKDFGLVDDDAPRTPQEYVDRIKSGMVTFPSDEEFIKTNANMSMNGWGVLLKPAGTLRWRDPAVKEDRDGYCKATADFEATERPVYDAIAILDPEEALAAVQSHEKATLH